MVREWNRICKIFFLLQWGEKKSIILRGNFSLILTGEKVSLGGKSCVQDNHSHPTKWEERHMKAIWSLTKGMVKNQQTWKKKHSDLGIECYGHVTQVISQLIICVWLCVWPIKCYLDMLEENQPKRDLSLGWRFTFMTTNRIPELSMLPRLL